MCCDCIKIKETKKSKRVNINHQIATCIINTLILEGIILNKKLDIIGLQLAKITHTLIKRTILYNLVFLNDTLIFC